MGGGTDRTVRVLVLCVDEDAGAGEVWRCGAGMVGGERASRVTVTVQASSVA